MTKQMTANNSQNEVPSYHHHQQQQHSVVRTMSAARRERVTDHPLKSRSNSPLVVVPSQIIAVTAKNSSAVATTPPGEVDSTSTGTHSSLTTTINTVSLIQSAARSVLDSVYTPTSTNVSDDEDDECDAEKRRRQRQNLPIPTLESLQKQSLPAMPDEQDRKRFVGCLAAVLASAYDYDVADHEEDPSHAAESYAYLNRTEQGHDEDGDDDEETENYYACDPDVSFADTNEEEHYLSNACSASFEYSDFYQLPGVTTEQQQSRRQQQQQQQYSPSREKRHRKKSTLARNRHRKRRYDLMSQLLLSSAELLLLDKSQARAFLPMLARVLMPPTASQKTSDFRIRQQKLQQQQQQQQSNSQQEEVASTNSDRTPTKTSSSDQDSDTYNTPQRNSDTNNPTTDNGINHYHFSPTTAIPVSRQIPLPEDSPQGNNDNDSYWFSNGLHDEDHLRPFLESLSPGAGYRCLSLLLLQHLLNSAEGYDARIRHVIKKLGVIVLVHELELERDLEVVVDDTSDPKGKSSRYETLVAAATRKFEALEHSIAVRLIRLSKEQQRLEETGDPQASNQRNSRRRQRSSRQSEAASLALSREQFVRSLKIGSAGLVAGTIFAVTGGLAAPGIAAGVAAFAGSTAATAAVAALVSSTPAVTAIFGVGGGSLAAYKMNRRTQGLTEFEFRRQDKKLVDRGSYEADELEEAQAELFSTVCISGWLRDQRDFERPWGILPSNPRIRDRLELLERFYSVYRPDHVTKCKSLLLKWKGEEEKLWNLLRQKYGRDPDHLYPIESPHDSSFFHRGLTLEQEEVLNELFVELGYVTDAQDVGQNPATKPETVSAFEDVRRRLQHPFLKERRQISEEATVGRSGRFHFPSNHNSSIMDESFQGPTTTDALSFASSGFDSVATSQIASGKSTSTTAEGDQDDKELPKHIATVWDYHAKYGGEIYTVKWESEMLIEVCDSVADLAFDLINGATAQLLRQTALHTLLSAVAWPYALVSAANVIDGTWTLAVERADEAGKELARSLLFSRAGHRPVTLVGFSFGARAIYSCLKELAKYQEKWETSRENSRNGGAEEPGEGKEEYSWTMREPASVVEDVIVMGLPNHLSLGSWKACRQVVGGRIVNCYSRKDLILSLMFQLKRLAGALRPVCGTCPVDVPGVENIDVSDLISGHQDYCLVAGEILKRVRHGQPFRATANFMYSDGGGALVTT